jgi:predicted small lipoprotein YifL
VRGRAAIAGGLAGPALGAVALALALPLAACGKKGLPLPPLRLVAAAAQDLTVRQQGNELAFELAYPQTTASGQALPGLAAVEVLELERPLPAAGDPVPVDPREFAAAAAPRLRLEGAELASSVVGDRLRVRLVLGEPPPTGRVHTFAVRTQVTDGEWSAPSNLVAIVPVAPPPAPDALAAEARADGIALSWRPVDAAAGFNVYRRDAPARGYGEPLAQTGPGEPAYLDATAAYGRRYVYTVRAFGPQTPAVESAPAGEIEVDYQDRFGPPPPAGLVALAEGTRVRLHWEASPAPDVAGYLVERQDPEQEFHRVTPEPVAGIEFVDEGLVAGLRYRYRVRGVDALGNVGEPSEEAAASTTGP